MKVFGSNENCILKSWPTWPSNLARDQIFKYFEIDRLISLTETNIIKINN